MTTFGDILLKNEGPGPTIVPMKAQKDGVGFANLFYEDIVWTDELTSALHSTNDASLLKRDPANGAWTFKANAELDLLQHVENVVAMSDANNAAVGGYGQKDASDAVVDASKTVLRAIDQYCTGKQWMYHVGHEKGEMIKPFLRESISSFKSNPERTGRFIVVDCGTYCGYSAILLASTIKECSPDLEFTVLSTEINPKHIGVATKMIKMAKLEKYITVIQTESVETALAEHVGPNDPVDFVFFDHAKDQYLSDLQSLEKRGRMKKGTHVVADNVIVSEVRPILLHASSLSFEINLSIHSDAHLPPSSLLFPHPGTFRVQGVF